MVLEAHHRVDDHAQALVAVGEHLGHHIVAIGIEGGLVVGVERGGSQRLAIAEEEGVDSILGDAALGRRARGVVDGAVALHVLGIVAPEDDFAVLAQVEVVVHVAIVGAQLVAAAGHELLAGIDALAQVVGSTVHVGSLAVLGLGAVLAIGALIEAHVALHGQGHVLAPGVGAALCGEVGDRIVEVGHHAVDHHIAVGALTLYSGVGRVEHCIVFPLHVAILAHELIILPGAVEAGNGHEVVARCSGQRRRGQTHDHVVATAHLGEAVAPVTRRVGHRGEGPVVEVGIGLVVAQALEVEPSAIAAIAVARVVLIHCVAVGEHRVLVAPERRIVDKLRARLLLEHVVAACKHQRRCSQHI